MQKIIIFICLPILFFACRTNESSQENVNYQYKGDTLYLSENSNVLSKIQLTTVQSTAYSTEFNATGTVKAITGKIAEIAAPFDGRVTQSFVQLGQRVRAGTPVFELSSTAFFEATKNYFQTLQTKKMMEVNLQRQKDLVQHGVGIQKELEEAETNYELARNDFENVAAGLRIFNIDPDQLVMGQALKVVSPIDGEILKSDIIIGQYVRDDAAPLAIVADLSKVWVVAQIKERYINQIQLEDQVEIYSDAYPSHEMMGKVYHISELLDEETRSVSVLIVYDNDQKLLKPGMFASIHFVNSPEESILIPSKALLQAESGTYVFIQIDERTYLKRFVKSVTARQNQALITEGLKAGDVIVSEGGVYLMAN